MARHGESGFSQAACERRSASSAGSPSGPGAGSGARASWPATVDLCAGPSSSARARPPTWRWRTAIPRIVVPELKPAVRPVRGGALEEYREWGGPRSARGARRRRDRARSRPGTRPGTGSCSHARRTRYCSSRTRCRSANPGRGRGSVPARQDRGWSSTPRRTASGAAQLERAVAARESWAASPAF